MFESLTLAYNAALSGVGVAIGVRAFVASDLAAGRLVQPVAHVRRSEIGFNMYYSATRARKGVPPARLRSTGSATSARRNAQSLRA